MHAKMGRGVGNKEILKEKGDRKMLLFVTVHRSCFGLNVTWIVHENPQIFANP